MSDDPCDQHGEGCRSTWINAGPCDCGRSDDLHNRIAEAGKNWALAFPISSNFLCRTEEGEQKLARIWGDQIAEAVMAVVQPEIDGWIEEVNDALNHNDENCEVVKERDRLRATIADLLQRCDFADQQGKPELTTAYIRICLAALDQPEETK